MISCQCNQPILLMNVSAKCFTYKARPRSAIGGHLTRKSGGPGFDTQSGNIRTFVSPSAFSRRAVVSYWRKYVHKVLVNRLGGLSLPRKSVVRLTGRPDMTLDVYRERKTTIQKQSFTYIAFVA